LASGSADKSIKIWRTYNWSLKQTLAGHDFIVEALAFNPTSTRLVSADGAGNTIRAWRISDGAVLRVFNNEKVAATRTIVFSPQGLFAWGGDQQVVNVGRLGIP
jgi:F-box and WD-40 domain protein 1/11